MAFSARLRVLLAGERNVGEALVDDALEAEDETLCVVHGALVETERLLIEVTEKVERFDRHVGALQGTLQEAPEVLQPVGVYLSVNVRLGVVNDVMLVPALVHAVVGAESVSVESRTEFDVLTDGLLQFVLAAGLQPSGGPARCLYRGGRAVP